MQQFFNNIDTQYVLFMLWFSMWNGDCSTYVKNLNLRANHRRIWEEKNLWWNITHIQSCGFGIKSAYMLFNAHVILCNGFLRRDSPLTEGRGFFQRDFIFAYTQPGKVSSGHVFHSTCYTYYHCVYTWRSEKGKRAQYYLKKIGGDFWKLKISCKLAPKKATTTLSKHKEWFIIWKRTVPGESFVCFSSRSRNKYITWQWL